MTPGEGLLVLGCDHICHIVKISHLFVIFSSPELKVQVSVWIHFFSRTTGPISTKHGTKPIWVNLFE